jgi:osmoprotectant transport system ATP-binding protein
MNTRPIVEFRSVRYEAGGANILNDLSFSVHRGEVLVLLGESGCGKTTTLRLINRLIEPTSGKILIDGQSSTDLDAIKLRRSVGYVLQDGGLFPHMTVAENVGLTLKLADSDAREAKERVSEMLDLVQLDPAKFAGRFPHELSGGQRQRVGVARALVPDPELLLLDEPFGALDALTRNALQREFARLVSELGKTAVFVTHDLHEAIILGSRIALMDRGKLVLLGTPEVFMRSEIPLVREYLGTIETTM